MWNAHMNDALVKALDPQLARIELKNIANHKSTALEQQLLFAQLVENIAQKDITRTHIDRHKLNTISAFSPSIIRLLREIDNLTVEEIHTMEQDIAHGINVVQSKHWKDPNFKEKPFFSIFCKNCSRSEHSISTCLGKRYTKLLNKPNFQKQTFNQAMKGNQNLPNRHVKSNNMTGKPLSLSNRCRSNSGEQRNHSRHRSPNKFSQNISKPYYGNNNFRPPSRNGSPYPRPNFQSNSQYNSRAQSPHYNRDGNRSRRPFSRNRLRNVKKYITSLLDQEQTDNTTSNTEKTETSNVSEETLFEQQFNGLLLELKQETQDEYFNCQEECNTLTETYILFNSCRNNIWALPLTIYTQQTLNHKRTIFPPRLEIDFILDSGATLNILNTDTWNHIKENHKLHLKASTFVLSAANISFKNRVKKYSKT